MCAHRRGKGGGTRLSRGSLVAWRQIFGTKNKDFDANDTIVVTQKYMLHPTGAPRQTWDVILVRRRTSVALQRQWPRAARMWD